MLSDAPISNPLDHLNSLLLIRFGDAARQFESAEFCWGTWGILGMHDTSREAEPACGFHQPKALVHVVGSAIRVGPFARALAVLLFLSNRLKRTYNAHGPGLLNIKLRAEQRPFIFRRLPFPSTAHHP